MDLHRFRDSFDRSRGVRSGRPQEGEFADYAKSDIEAVDGDDAVAALVRQAEETIALLAPLRDDAIRSLAYAPGKWTVKEVIGHLCDDERIFAYRALCIARSDTRPQAGFDERLYVASAAFESLRVAQLVADYAAVRVATITLLQGLSPEAWVRRGTVNGYSASPRGLAFHIAGHELRHTRALRERYGLKGDG